MAGIVFVARWLVNQNAKFGGGARIADIHSLVEKLRAHGWRIEQMPCPELGA
jgi:hypothetical protein